MATQSKEPSRAAMEQLTSRQFALKTPEALRPCHLPLARRSGNWCSPSRVPDVESSLQAAESSRASEALGARGAEDELIVFFGPTFVCIPASPEVHW
jgi:hypothetical protein